MFTLDSVSWELGLGRDGSSLCCTWGLSRGLAETNSMEPYVWSFSPAVTWVPHFSMWTLHMASSGISGFHKGLFQKQKPPNTKHLSNLCSHHNSHCPIGESKSHRWGTTRWVNAKCGSVAAAKANVHYPCIHIWKNTWSPNQRSSHCMNPHPCTPLVNPKIFFLSFKGKMITSMIWTEIFPMLLNLIMKQGSLKLWQSWSGWKRRRLSSLQTYTVAPWWPVTHSITAFQVSKHSPRSGF